ncbi:SPOR domain-containing protein [Kitasatospora sp. NPDC056446]|uniref:SPOR domain-containing protein n=1 Tax=Kitasatospora sp. NPDC056446 TaxID=3345819 RepID=UPI003683EEB6
MGTYRVMRQDDNGNRFLVAKDLDRAEALRRAAELEARGHKQLYWVEAVDEAGTAGAADAAGNGSRTGNDAPRNA